MSVLDMSGQVQDPSGASCYGGDAASLALCCLYLAIVSVLLYLLFAFLSILGLVDAAYAANSSNAVAVVNSITDYTGSSDIAQAVLGSVFGRVKGVSALSSVPASIFGVIFESLSYGALAIEAALLIYMAAKIIAEANVDSRNLIRGTMLWQPLKCALSTVLLIPNSTGYSMIHSLVMMVVVQGVGLANMFWSNVCTYLVQDQKTFYTSTILNYAASTGADFAQAIRIPDISLIDAATYDSSITNIAKANKKKDKALNVGSATVLRSLLCSYALAQKLDNLRGYNLRLLQERQTNLAASGKTDTELDSCITALQNDTPLQLGVADGSLYKDDTSTGKVSFPGNNLVDNYQCVDAKLKDSDHALANLIEFPAKKLIGICGAIFYGDLTSNDANTQETVAVKHEALVGSGGMVAALASIAQDTINWRAESSSDFAAAVQEFVENNYKGYVKTGSNLPCYSSKQNSNYCSKTIVTAIDDKTTLPDASNKLLVNIPAALVTAAQNYQSAVYNQLADRLTKQANTSKDKDKEEIEALYQKLTKRGWMFIGNYFFDLSKSIGDLKTGTNSTIDDSYLLSSNEPRDDAYQLSISKTQFSTVKKILGNDSNVLYDALLLVNSSAPIARQQLQATGGLIESLDSADTIANTIKKYSAAEEFNVSKRIKLLGLATGMDPTRISVAAAFSSLPMQICSTHIARIIDVWTTQMASSDHFPIYRLEEIGKTIIAEASGILADFYSAMAMFITTSITWPLIYIAAQIPPSFGTAFGATMGAVRVITSLLSLTTAGTQIAFQFLTMFMPFVLGVAVPLLAMGVLLALYVPLIPTLLFIFGGISWLISLIALLVAAPIICFLILWSGASQDNPLLSREAEQFIHQLVGTFFRPALMVIGFVAGMMLSYIGFDMLNLAISKTYTHFFNSKVSVGEFSNGASFKSNVQNIGNLVIGLGFLGVYTYVAISIVNMSFSLIHLLYSETMRLVGVSVPAAGLEERNVEAVKGGATKFNEGFAGGVRGVGEKAQQNTEASSTKMSGVTQEFLQQREASVASDRMAAKDKGNGSEVSEKKEGPKKEQNPDPEKKEENPPDNKKKEESPASDEEEE